MAPPPEQQPRADLWFDFLRARDRVLRAWQREGKLSHHEMAALASCDAQQVASLLRRDGGNDAS